MDLKLLKRFGFNTQPPEGGWKFVFFIVGEQNSFNTQPPEGGCGFNVYYSAS